MAYLNWIDLTILIVFILFALEGLGRSFVGEVLDLLSFILSLVSSLRFYNSTAALLQKNFHIAHSLANVIGFFLIWSLTEIVLSIIIRLFLGRFHFLSWVDRRFRYFSTIPSFLRGVFFVSILLVLLATFPIQPQVKSAVDDSKIGSVLLSYSYKLEAPLKGVFGGITQDTLTFLTVEPKTNESVDLGFKLSKFQVRTDLEDQMIVLVNKERTSRGLKALTFNSALREIARGHSSDMFMRGYFSHYSPEGKSVANRAEEAGYDYQVIGENLAYAPNLELAHNGLMNSPGHRANILSTDFNKIGIGIMDGGNYGLMITQVFSN